MPKVRGVFGRSPRKSALQGMLYLLTRDRRYTALSFVKIQVAFEMKDPEELVTFLHHRKSEPRMSFCAPQVRRKPIYRLKCMESGALLLRITKV